MSITNHIVYLYRYRYTVFYTQSILIAEDAILSVIEPPWLDNKRNASCVPPGKYSVAYMPRSASGKYKRVYHVLDVPGRSGILIHPGNLPKHTIGCLLPGMSSKRGYVSNSRAALDLMIKRLGGGFVLVIS